ncbi:efflux RND transporter periplasmic adaptor subunit [Ferrimonas sp. YFM]|uniref:efflux RND transporter periplasmic adaptor subunit n=1 Tax=Ferrimonas sp. YFM TaxID=3028878 RepID=UPI002573FA47|nr:efflux RND transporter periplasmic adaptor subunit [Ferrimonas sp. YFM]BDY04495.1 RND transporter MFP subunit [Ferrimonas sp. YFM]
MKRKTLTPLMTALLLAFTQAPALAGDDHDHQANTDLSLITLDLDDHEHGVAEEGHDHSSEGPEHGHESGDHGHDEGEEHEEGLRLSPAQSALAGIEVATVTETSLDFRHPVPTQLLTNPNLTSALSLPVDARVIARHVTPGQEVEPGAKLLTLASSAIADTQGRHLLALAEWRRVKSLGKQAVSASRYQQARIDLETSLQDLLALGMTQSQIDSLDQQESRLGQFTLLAPHAGTVQQDNSVMQQNQPALSTLMVLADEHILWANAQVSASQATLIRIGQKLTVRVGEDLVQATVIGRDHQLDPRTRTEAVRLELTNPDHRLHAGQFATAYISQSQRRGIVLPDSALARSPDGDWMVYLYDDGRYSATEVQVLSSQEGMNLVSGIQPGSQVAVQGAFFLASEQAKSGFEIHNH